MFAKAFLAVTRSRKFSGIVAICILQSGNEWLRSAARSIRRDFSDIYASECSLLVKQARVRRPLRITCELTVHESSQGGMKICRMANRAIVSIRTVAYTLLASKSNIIWGKSDGAI